MRSRSRSSNYGYTPSGPGTASHITGNSDPWIATTNASARPLGSRTEVIVDDPVSPKSIKFVSHELVDNKAQACSLATWRYRTNSNPSTRVYHSSPWDLWNDLGKNPPTLSWGNFSISYDQSEAALMSKAEANLLDENRVDSLLNILEAGQTVDSVIQLTEFVKKLLDPKVHIILNHRAPKGLRGQVVQLKDLASLHLGWSFALSPLISDIRRIVRDMSRIRGKLRRLADSRYIPRSGIATSDGTISFVTPPASSYYNSSGSNYHSTNFWRIGSIYTPGPPKRIVGVRGVITQRPETALFRELDFMMARYFATGPLSLAWEKVPFSFVLDWFVETSQVLSRLDNALVGGKVRVLGAWHTEQAHIIVPVIFTGYYDRAYPYDLQQVALCELKKYTRTPRWPELSAQAAGRFGKKQGALSVSLLYQKIANLISKR